MGINKSMWSHLGLKLQVVSRLRYYKILLHKFHKIL